MTKTQIRAEFNRIKNENYFLRGYKLIFDYGWVPELEHEVIGQCKANDKEIRINELYIGKMDIMDVLIHEIAHAWCYYLNNKGVYISQAHGDQWYKKYQELGGQCGDEYRKRFAEQGITVSDGKIIYG